MQLLSMLAERGLLSEADKPRAAEAIASAPDHPPHQVLIDKGFVTVTDRPGIGVEMNEEAARKAQMPGTQWFAA